MNRGVVELETARAAGISVRIAEDLANVIDDGATRRVLPVIGKGALQNITDLKLLRGIDMAILQTDVLDYARQQNLFPGIESWATYITKLYNEEMHVIAPKSIQKLHYLPEAQTDFILAVIGEELGVLGIFGVVFLYGMIAYAGLRTARRAAGPPGGVFRQLMRMSSTIWRNRDTPTFTRVGPIQQPIHGTPRCTGRIPPMPMW